MGHGRAHMPRNMPRRRRTIGSWALACALLAGATAATAAPTASAPEPAPLSLRVVGGLAGLNQYTRHEEPFWARELPRLSGGRLRAEVVPFDRAGIRGQDMLRLMQLGVVPFGTALLSLSTAQDPLLGAPDLAGLSPDLPSLRRHLTAFRPVLERTLRERHGIELLAVYIYPAQMTFCNRPLASLSDLAGRKVRISSPTQADWVEANSAAWQALPAPWKDLLRQQLPRREQAIWLESDRETGEGLACNVGAAACLSGRKGRMTEVRETPADARRRREIFESTVLTRWLQRCGPACADTWNQTLGPASGFTARPPRP